MALDHDAPVPLPVRVTAPAQPLGLWASYRAARRNILELIPAAAYREPVLSGGRQGGPGWIMVMDPPWLEHVLKTREANYPKSDVTKRLLKPRRGESVFTAEGAAWRWQHRAMTPMFQHRALRALGPVMTSAAEVASARIDAEARAQEGVADLYPQMVAATCDVICDAVLSGRESLDRDELTAGVTRFVETAGRISFLDILGAPGWIPRPTRMFDRNGRRMDARMDAVVAARLARGPSDPPDLLDMLIVASDPQDGRRMTSVEIANNLLTFIVAGHETTALALTWALYLLALDQGAQARLRTQVQGVLGDRAAGAEDLGELGPVRQVIEEAMRLYPPAGFLTRQAREADEIAGRPVRPRTTVILPIYALHRHTALWEAPDRFDPERFRPEAATSRHRYAYLPFSAGPRICLGMAFALMEAQIILATLVARFRFRPVAETRPEPRMVITLRPDGGLPLAVERL